MQHGVKPADDCLWVLEVADALQRDEKRVMDGILGFRAVAEHPQCRRVQPRAMAFQKQPEAATVAGTSGNGQLGIGRPDMRLMTHGLKDAPTVEKVRIRILAAAATQSPQPRTPRLLALP